MLQLSDTQKAIVETVREFVTKEVIPVADEMEHDDEFPDAIVEQMKELGLFGLTVPEEYGGIGESLTAYALAVVELARGWMSLSGVLNTHFMGCYLINKFGTDDQRQKFLPKMATGEWRAALAMSEPEAGSDVQAIRTKAVKDGDDYIVNGSKMWLTNGLRSSLVMTLVKTDLSSEPPHRGISMLIVEKEGGNPAPAPGLDVGKNIEKMGYKGVETTEMTFNDYRLPKTSLLGTEEGHGFRQVLDGIEVGRVNVAARAVGLSTRAFEEAIRYSQERKAFGKAISQHQAVQI
ncbi:MAG: acyl-CoA dehydrogenase family protein, partial [Actinomycetota bacterium]|nr:acyl-CoA dehydrogenase family protein [Actinomycetota bacterium]